MLFLCCERRQKVKILAILSALCAFLAVVTITLLCGAEEVLTAGGSEEGKITEITGGDDGVVKIAGKEVRLSDCVRLNFGNRKVKSRAGFLVVMTNGDRIVGDFSGGGKDGVIVDTKSLGKRKVSIDNLLAAFNLSKACDSAFVEEKTALDNAADLVFLDEDQETEGIIRKITDKEITVKVQDLGEITLTYDKVRGIKLAPLSKPEEIKGLKTTVYLVDGSRLSGKLLGYKQGKLEFNWFGIKTELEKKEIMSLYFSGGKLDHLSDLEPASVKETPFFDKFLYRCQIDHSLVGKQTISIRKKKFFKGVSVHSKTELTYSVEGKYSRFRSTIGIDDEAKGKGDVVFIVYGDDKELFRSKNITGKSEPRLIDVSIDKVKELKLVVDFGKAMDTMDRAVWAEAVLVKK
jgi:hypothetical protein